MKKLLLAALAIACIASASAQERVITPAQLPQSAQNFIATHYKADKVSIATSENSPKEFTVRLESGTKIEFDKDGEWSDIESKGKNPLPASIIPANIKKYVDARFPKNKIVAIDRDSRFIDVELDNKVEIKFNKKGEVVEVDID